MEDNSCSKEHGQALLADSDEDGRFDVAKDTEVKRTPFAWSDVYAEAIAQSAISVPLALTLLTRFIQGFADLAIIGRLLGSQALAGASLALTIQFTTLGVITMGFGDAVASLCSQALGARHPQLCGLWLQTGMVCSTAAALCLVPLWWFAGDIIAATGSDGTTAGYASTYARWSTLRAFIQVNYYCYKVYLASQRRLLPDVIGCLVGLIIGIPTDILLIGGTCAFAADSPLFSFNGRLFDRKAEAELSASNMGNMYFSDADNTSNCWGGLGFIGAPIAAVAVRAITASAVLILAQTDCVGRRGELKVEAADEPAADTANDLHTVDTGTHDSVPVVNADPTASDCSATASAYADAKGGPAVNSGTWGGLALHSRQDGALRPDRLRSYFGTSLPAALRSLVDQGQILSLALMAARLGPAAAAAHNACIELYACVGGAYLWANCDAVLVRVGRALGAGNAEGAQRSAVMGLSLATFFALTFPPALLLPTKRVIGRLLSSDDAILSITADTMLPMCALIGATAVVFSLLGAAIGSGRAAAGGRAWMVGLMLVVPTAYAWAIAPGDGGVPALWGACAVGYGVTSAILAWILVTSDWRHLARQAAQRQS